MTTLTPKQLLVLYLIACDPGLKDIKSMINVYERADYPFGLVELVKELFDLQYIKVTHYLDNDTPALFGITESGRAYLDSHLNKKELLDYIHTMQEPSFLLEVMQDYLGE